MNAAPVCARPAGLPPNCSTGPRPSGEGGGIRTLDLRIKSPLLCRLSYAPVMLKYRVDSDGWAWTRAYFDVARGPTSAIMGRFAGEVSLAHIPCVLGRSFMQNAPSLTEVTLTVVDEDSVVESPVSLAPERTAAIWVNRLTGVIGVIFLALALVAWLARHGHYRLVLAFLIVALLASILHSYTFENGDEV